MVQINLFETLRPEWPDPFILISLAPQYYDALVISQTKKLEYRRGQFITQPATAFVYATLPKNSKDIGFPHAEIGAIVKLGKPRIGLETVIRLKEEEDPHSRPIMKAWLEGFQTASAHPIERVIQFKKPITLTELRERFPGFQPPQRYLILNRNKELLTFLKERSEARF